MIYSPLMFELANPAPQHPRHYGVSLWRRLCASGAVTLAGPNDELAGFAAARLPQLLRDIHHAAGAVHPDLHEYDRVMVADRRTAVLLTPARFATNPPDTERKEPEKG